MNSFGVPFTSPFSPLDRYALRDSFIFAGWKKTGKRFIQIQKLRGTDTDGTE
jgi:hypothetical protein